MDWDLKHEKHLAFYLNLEEEGNHVKVLDSRPEIYDDLIPIWQAFKTIQKVEGCNIQEIKAYLDLIEITDLEEKKEYLFYISNLIEKRLCYGN